MRAITFITGRRAAAGGALLLALLVPATTLAASTAWTRQFGTTAEEMAGGIATDSEGITVVGTTSGDLKGDLQGPSDVVVRRYDRSGHVLWTRQFGTVAQDWGIDVAADGSGITVLGATDGEFGTADTGDGIKDLFIRRYDRAGNHLWTRQFGTDEDEEPGAIAADSTGVIVVGTTRGALTGTNAPDDHDAIVRRYDRSGNVVFTRQFGTAAGDTADAVAIDGAGFTVGGGTDGDLQGNNSGPFTDAFVRRYNAAGTVQWTRQWGQRGDDQVLSMAADGTGITSVGYTHKDAQGNEPSQAFIRRHDRDGDLVFSKIFGSPNSEIAWGVAADSGGLTVTGYTLRRPRRRQQGHVRRVRPSLQPVRQRDLGPPVRHHRRGPGLRRGSRRQGLHGPRPHQRRPGRQPEGRAGPVRPAVRPLAPQPTEGDGESIAIALVFVQRHLDRRGGPGPASARC